MQPQFYNPDTDDSPSPESFRPRADDTTGLSVSRAKYKSASTVAENQRAKQFYVATLRAGDLRRRGIQVVPCPLDGDPGHAEISSLTYGNRKEVASQEFMVQLAHELCITVEGPLPREE